MKRSPGEKFVYDGIMLIVKEEGDGSCEGCYFKNKNCWGIVDFYHTCGECSTNAGGEKTRYCIFSEIKAELNMKEIDI